mmetsp:Transcript_9385/g.27345  ORF Transcript_9385/g.27345 Transcript_9385/m.27345 type:complete len:510 (+) Transcript_9385:75-1604(+)
MRILLFSFAVGLASCAVVPQMGIMPLRRIGAPRTSSALTVAEPTVKIDKADTEASKWFAKMDRDGDGEISVKEFLEGYKNLESELTGEQRQSMAVAAERLLATVVRKVDDEDALGFRGMKDVLPALDDEAGQNLKLSDGELLVLSLLTFASFGSPFLFEEKVTTILIPVAAALAASLGLTSEYVGKVAIAGGKEVAANSLQTAAEAESRLAAAERSKSVLPLCAGMSAAMTACALVAPFMIKFILPNAPPILAAEYFLLFPVVSIFTNAVATIAADDTEDLVARAKAVGERRFATRNDVGITWKSIPERVSGSSIKDRKRWIGFLWAVAPAPLIATVFPGGLGEKCIMASAVAAAQSAYQMFRGELAYAKGTDAIAIKLRIAAISEAYSNQGARAGQLLPFTSALGGLCVAAAAFLVELNPTLACVFPGVAAVFAAAASVAKARCEVDFAATNSVSSEFAQRAEASPAQNIQDPFFRPWFKVNQFIGETATKVATGIKAFFAKPTTGMA